MLVLELHLEQRVGQRLDDRCHYLNRIFLRQTLSSKGPDLIPTPRRITCFADFGGPALFRVQEGRRRTQTPFVSLLESSPIREERANRFGRIARTELTDRLLPFGHSLTVIRVQRVADGNALKSAAILQANCFL